MKVKIAGVSLLHAAVVISGILAMISRVNATANGTLPTGMDAVWVLCANTNAKEICNNTLTPTARNNSCATVKDFARVAFEAILKDIKSTLSKTDSFRKTIKLSEYNMKILKTCNDVLEKPISSLEEAISNITASNDPTLSGLTDKLKYTAIHVALDKSNCDIDIMYPDNINPDVFDVLTTAMSNLASLGFNAHYIVDQIEKMSSDSLKDGNV